MPAPAATAPADLLLSWRHHPLTGHAVRIAPARAQRPSDYNAPAGVSRCPFCAGAEEDTPDPVLTLTGERGEWLTRVVPNQFPSVDGEAGAQEVIIESPRHVSRFIDLTPAEAAAAVTAWASRLVSWREQERFDYILMFKNEGAAAGASLRHAHSQTLALPTPPHEAARVWRAIAEGAGPIEHPVWCDSQWSVTAPDAPRFAHELCLRPGEAAPSLEGLAAGHGAEHLATTLQRTLTAVKQVSGCEAYNLILQTPPASLIAATGDAWWLEVVPRTSSIAGLELATGLWVSSAPPEQTARLIGAALGSRNPDG